jgi:thymidylate synthase (FAD)
MLQLFKDSVIQSIDSYRILVENKIKPQIAREVLPNCFYTDVIGTFNFRSLRNMLDLRCDESAHPEMRRLMIPLLVELYNKYPVLFEDIYNKVKSQGDII